MRSEEELNRVIVASRVSLYGDQQLEDREVLHQLFGSFGAQSDKLLKLSAVGLPGVVGLLAMQGGETPNLIASLGQFADMQLSAGQTEMSVAAAASIVAIGSQIASNPDNAPLRDDEYIMDSGRDMIADSFPALTQDDIQQVHKGYEEFVSSLSEGQDFSASLSDYRESMEAMGDVPSRPGTASVNTRH